MAIEDRLHSMPPGQKLVLLNLPQRSQGAHMLYNASMLQILLSPPLSSSDLYKRVVTFEPMTYGDSDLLIASRLKPMLACPQNFAFFAFDQDKQNLVPLYLGERGSTESTLVDQPMAFNVSNRQEELWSPALDQVANGIDFIDVELTAKRQSAANKTALLSWQGQPGSSLSHSKYLRQELIYDGQPHHYQFAVSQYKSWLLSRRITRLKLQLPQGQYTLNQVKFLNADRLIPSLHSDPQSIDESPDGTSRIKNRIGRFDFDASNIPGVNAVAIEISRPDGWFEHYSGSFRDTQLSPHALKTMVMNKTRGQFELDTATLPAAGYYEVSIAGLSDRHQVLGYVSDPINLQIAGEQAGSGSHSR